jgi:hypothetical protein
MKKMLTRRQALKTLLAATGAITAASFVPEKWVKPLVKTGVVPVHAQASIDLFQAEAVALDSDFLPMPNPYELGFGFNYIGNIRARLFAVKSKVAIPAYCANLTIIKSQPEMFILEGQGYIQPPYTLSPDWLNIGNLIVASGNVDDTITLKFDLYNCPAFSGPILQTINIVFTLVGMLGGT